MKSKWFVCLISRNSINSANDLRANFSRLQSDSPCDNVLLEFRLALELLGLGLLEGVIPVLIGDSIPESLAIQDITAYKRFERPNSLPFASLSYSRTESGECLREKE